MKHSKRYIIFTAVIAALFGIEFYLYQWDRAEIGEFRGGNLEAEVWNPLIASDVNSNVIKLLIDNKEYTSENLNIYMNNNRSIMVPISILRDALNCSAHVYSGKELLVEKHNTSVLFSLDEYLADASGEAVTIESAFTQEDGEYYVSLTDLSDLLGYNYSYDMNSNTLTTVDASESSTNIPASYDLRAKNRVGQIRNQGSYGTCWAFAALSAMESSLLPEESTLFSVDHMSMSNSFNITQYDGGEYTMGMAYLAAWQGPVYETDDPYGDNKTMEGLSPVKHVQEMRIIDGKDYEGIKNAVFKYGGVQSSLYSSLKSSQSRSSFYNAENKAYCYMGQEKPNHDVVIIGWDDNYSKENFAVQPEGDGAFICQNSWGSEFGEDGIFYVSYYDVNIGTHNIVYTGIEDTDNYDNIYQSDLCGWVGKLGYGREDIYGANVFTANQPETVTAASFYATAADTSYELYIVKNFQDEESFANKTLVAQGSLEQAGYYTIDFDKEIYVEAGERYGVLLYIKTTGATMPLAIEYDSKDKALDNVDLEDGEGYISYNGTRFVNVKEQKDCNLCIKAFTNNR